MEVFLVYLWLKLDILIVCATFIAILSGIIGVITPSAVLLADGDSYNPERWRAERGLIWKARRNLGLKIFIPFLLFVILVPSSKDTAILVASSVAIDVAKSPEGEKIGKLIRGKANEMLDKELENLTSKVTK